LQILLSTAATDREDDAKDREHAAKDREYGGPFMLNTLKGVPGASAQCLECGRDQAESPVCNCTHSVLTGTAQTGEPMQARVPNPDADSGIDTPGASSDLAKPYFNFMAPVNASDAIKYMLADTHSHSRRRPAMLLHV
jgi:hypothetical protein